VKTLKEHLLTGQATAMRAQRALHDIRGAEEHTVLELICMQQKMVEIICDMTKVRNMVNETHKQVWVPFPYSNPTLNENFRPPPSQIRQRNSS
jgi:hypothetical protein